MEHILYTPKDFKGYTENQIEGNQLYDMVVNGGLSVCKVCHEYEAGLDTPCEVRVKAGFDITVTCNHCGGTNVDIHLNGSYQVMSLYCNQCSNEGEESV